MNENQQKINAAVNIMVRGLIAHFEKIIQEINEAVAKIGASPEVQAYIEHLQRTRDEGGDEIEAIHEVAEEARGQMDNDTNRIKVQALHKIKRAVDDAYFNMRSLPESEWHILLEPLTGRISGILESANEDLKQINRRMKR